MKAKYKKLWVKKLLSRRMKQGRGALRSKNDTTSGFHYCCLGVLRTCIPKLPNGGKRSKLDEDGKLTSDELKEVGLNYQSQVFLIRMNDVQYASFEKIAAHIKKKY